jgi:uncharacterized protein YfaS (alpha-2-macroglobulin family)
MTINLYKVGQKVRCSVVFTVDDVDTDPTTVTFKVKDPSGTTTTQVYLTDDEVVKTAVGVYYADVDTDEKGEWNFRWEGTGACAAVEEQAFNVTTAF